MADVTGGAFAMSDDPDPERLQALEARLKAARGPEEQQAPVAEDTMNQAQFAWQMVVELVAGIVIGFGIGYGLDRLFGTMPIFLVLFTLLGFVAGVRVMLRTATQMQERQAAEAAQDNGDG